jgi:hypothetical protein
MCVENLGKFKMSNDNLKSKIKTDITLEKMLDFKLSLFIKIISSLFFLLSGIL